MGALSPVATVYGEDLDPALIEKMMLAADTDKDGQIGFDEFKTIMRARDKDPQ